MDGKEQAFALKVEMAVQAVKGLQTLQEATHWNTTGAQVLLIEYVAAMLKREVKR